jgi:hypothetical protein
VAGHADHQIRCERARVLEGEAVLGQVHGVRAGGEGDIDALVDGDARAGREGGAHEREQRAAVEILLADLHEHARRRNVLEQPRDRIAERRRDRGPAAGCEDVRGHHAPAIRDRDDADRIEPAHSIRPPVGDDAFA